MHWRRVHCIPFYMNDAALAHRGGQGPGGEGGQEPRNGGEGDEALDHRLGDAGEVGLELGEHRGDGSDVGDDEGDREQGGSEDE